MRPIRRVVAVVCLLAASAAFGAKKPKPFRPSLAFSEIWHTSPAVESGDSFGLVGRFVVDAKMELDPEDVAAFAGDTWFTISLGNLQFADELGSDPEWTPGATSARLVETGDTGEQLVAYLDWSSSRLVVHVEADTGDEVASVAAEGYFARDRRRIVDETAGEMSLGASFAGWHTVRYRGAVRAERKLGPGHAAVRIKGRGVPAEFFTDPEESSFR
jgi:hypothetical protein